MSTMTREEREKVRRLVDKIERSQGDAIVATLYRLAEHDLPRALDAIDALEAEVADMRELLDTLVYWHDQGHIDESWWDAARDAIRMRPPAPVEPLTPEQIEALNPGVRKLVSFLRAHGFDTFDSGDGATHECGDMDLPWPYVHISVVPEKIASEARRLLSLARSQGWPIREQTPDGPSTVEAQHFPLAKASEHVAILSLYHVTDADLAGEQP